MSLTASLAKPVGPMPLGAWLLVGTGGLFIAWRQSTKGEDTPAPAAGDPLPTGGGLDMEGATGSYDGAPVVLSPVFNVPAPIVNINMPVPVPPPPVVVKPPPVTPRVPVPTHTTTTTRPVLHYTVKRGDTLWGIAAKLLGSGTRWTKIYSDNAAVIEAAAKAHGHSSSTGPTGRGHWIFPGTVLVVKK